MHTVNKPVSSPLPRYIRVTHIGDLTRLLARVLRDLQTGSISENKSRTIAYVANSYAKIYELSEIEKRLTAMESAIAQMTGPAGFTPGE